MNALIFIKEEESSFYISLIEKILKEIKFKKEYTFLKIGKETKKSFISLLEKLETKTIVLIEEEIISSMNFKEKLLIADISSKHVTLIPFKRIESTTIDTSKRVEEWRNDLDFDTNIYSQFLMFKTLVEEK